ncbi:MAG: hypothetical protein K8L97_13225 [Anaerolineae bacterium]|nr:hypothetical protein [Anaerolineae bacterium]
MELTRPNYPDILGYITGSQWADFGVVQAAAALRPPMVVAGRSFEIIVLLQNLSDVNVSAVVSVHVPEQDAGGKPERFYVQKNRLSVTLHPAEVGYLMIPVLCLPDTTFSNQYHINVDIQTNPLGKPQRVRFNDEQHPVNLDYYFYLTEDTINQIMLLRQLTFMTQAGGLLRSGISIPFGVSATEMGRFTKIKPRWLSLWSLGEHADARPLFDRYRETFVKDVLPGLNTATLYKPLFKATQHTFNRAGCVLHNAETHFIVETLLGVIQAATTPSKSFEDTEIQFFRVQERFEQGWPLRAGPLPLPNWCRGLLQLIGIDEAIILYPERSLAGPLLIPLLADGIDFGFHMLRPVTLSLLGEPQEIRIYSEYVVQMLQGQQAGMSYTEVYLPLVLAGTVISRQGIPGGPTQRDLMVRLTEIHPQHWAADDEDQQMVAGIVNEVVDWVLRQYTHWF